MASPSPPAGGFLIALGAVLGAIIGLVEDQPSLGLLIGLAAGGVAALAIWWRSR